MKPSTLEALEYSKVLGEVAQLVRGEPSAKSALALCPLDDAQAVESRLDVIDDLRRLTSLGQGLRLRGFADVAPLLYRVKPAGAVLEPTELAALCPVLFNLESIERQVARREDVASLRAFAQGISGFPALLEDIERSVNEEGEVLDGASHALKELREQIRSLDRRISRRLEELMREPGVEQFLQDNFVTKRSGRWVVPVRMDSKGMVQGVVHDVSRSGETAFMEPLEIISLSNKLEGLVADEKAEVIRILKALSKAVRAEADAIEQQLSVLVELDVLDAVGLFADKLRAWRPTVRDAKGLAIRGGRHPLLMLMKGTGVVPLDMILEQGQRVVVITGPNAGGKTIAIKTVGLLYAMALTGMPVPALEGSEFPMLDGILVDIGDEQSIEHSLSTFSAHASKIARMLSIAGERSLVLMDELGTGTDPVEGAAIGSAVLEELLNKGALTLATTHLVDIVGFVHRTQGMVNACMEFDTNTLTPLYRLRPGEPGQSHALSIAERFGLPARIVARARELSGRANDEMHGLLEDLRTQRVKFENATAEGAKLLQEARAKDAELTRLIKESQEGAKQRIAEAYEQAREIVSQVRREAAALIEEARKSRAKAALKDIDAVRDGIEQKLKELRPQASLSIDEVADGDRVHVRSLGYDATVVGVDHDRQRVRVLFGAKEVEVPVSDVLAPKEKSSEKKRKKVEPEGPAAMTEINLIGQRVDDAIDELEPFLNHAALDGVREVRVIHGMGTGALRRALRDHLKRHPLVASIRPAERHEGGDGATVVALR